VKCCPGAIEGEGNAAEGVVIVGHMPAAEEKRKGRPFVGPNGTLLDAELEYAGWSRSKVYVTNILCQPFKPIKGDKRTLLEQHPECVVRFERELAALQPRLVITLGTDACQYMTGMKVMKARGVPVFKPARGYYVMPTLQPIGAIQGDSSVTRHVIRDLRKIPRILSWPLDGSIKDVSYTVIDTAVAAQAFLDGLPLDRIVTLDIETDNRFVNVIDVWTDKLLCVGVGYVQDGQEVVGVMPANILLGLRWPDAQYTYQNAAFDRNGMKHYLGVELPIAHDTMMMSYALDERGGRDEMHDNYGGIHGLGPQADEYCGAEFYKDRMKGQRGEHPANLPTNVLYEYNANDVAYTLRLPDIYLPALHDDNVYDLYANRLMPLTRAYAENNYAGVNIDRRKLQDLILLWGPRFQEGEEHLQELAQEYGWDGMLNLNSPKQKSKFFYEVLGLEHPQAPSTARAVIEDLDHPWIDAYMEHARLDHIVKHYLIPGVRDIKLDGRMHPNTLLHGTATGRPTYVDPPLNTLPQAYTVGEYAELRSIFVPDSQDHVIAEFDYSQLEMWMAAGLGEDDHMLSALREGDIHAQTTTRVLHVKPDAPDWKTQRQRGKKVNFEVIYLIGPKELANPKKGIGGTQKEAQEHINNYFAYYDGYARYVQNTIETAKRDGELVTPYGRKRRFMLMTDFKQERQAVNFKGQSIGSDYTLSSLLQLQWDQYFRETLGCRILWTVYDSMVVNIPKRHLAAALDYIIDVMSSQTIAGLPTVPVEPKVGPNLYDVKTLVRTPHVHTCEHDDEPWYTESGKCLDCYVRSI